MPARRVGRPRATRASSPHDIEVKIAQLGQEVKTYMLQSGTTVGAALDRAGFDKAKDIKVNNRVADENTVLSSNSVITMVPKIDGGV